MRKDGIPYVSSGVYNPPFPAVPLQEMTLEEIKKKYLKMCAKSNGDPSVCSRCSAPCAEGKRAIQLLANDIYNDPPIPLYGGKTLIEKAKEENMKRRAELEKAQKEMKQAEEELKKEEKAPRKGKNSYVRVEGWWEDSLASGDQVKWICDNLGLSKTQAKRRIYGYKYSHGMAGSAAKEENPKQDIKKKETPKEETVNVTPEESVEKPLVSDSLENKVEKLMKLQEEKKKLMDDCYAKYEDAKKEYEKIKRKVDILYEAMDIANEV